MTEITRTMKSYLHTRNFDYSHITNTKSISTALLLICNSEIDMSVRFKMSKCSKGSSAQ
jgi:hypothetical protein